MARRRTPGTQCRVVWDLFSPGVLSPVLDKHRVTNRELDELADAVVRLLAAGEWPPGPPGAPPEEHEYGMVRFEADLGTLFGQALTGRPRGTPELWIFFALVHTGGDARVARVLQVVTAAAFSKSAYSLLLGISTRLPHATVFDGSLRRRERR